MTIMHTRPRFNTFPRGTASISSHAGGAVLPLCLLLSLAGAARAENAVATFSFEDHLKRAWSNELVFYPVDNATWGRKNLLLLGPEGKAVPLQWATADQSPNGKASVAFLANVPEFGKASYSLVVGGTAATDGELRASESATSIELGNALIGLRLHRGEKALTEGPFAQVRLPSGAWTGSGTIAEPARPTAHEAQVTAKGPVFLDATATYRFGERGSWRLRFRVVRGEPVVLVDETFDLPSAAVWRLWLAKGWSPTRLLYRNEKQDPSSQFGQQETWPLGPAADGQPAYVLEPWLHWNYRARQGNWFSVYGEATTDMLMVGAIRAASWLDPGRIEARQPQTPAVVNFTMEGDQLAGDFPLLWGRRQWMLGTTDRQRSLVDIAKPPELDERHSSPLPQLLLIKHGDFPLDLIKDYQFEWPDDHGKHPRMIITTADVAALRKTADVQAMRQSIAKNNMAKATIYLDQSMSDAIKAYLITGDPELGKHLCEAAAKNVQDVVDAYLKQTRLPTPGFAPHMRQPTAVCLLLADAVMDGGHMAPEVRRRIKAQAAFIGYTLNREDLYSPARGYAGLPNMTTSYYGYKAAAACFNPTHPQAKAWIDDALREMHDELEGWSDDNGGWLEAPHYAMVSYDALLGVSIMAHNAGLGGDLFHPRMKKVMEWFAKISTPPDSRYGGFRHLPPIGNTYMIEPTGQFGVIAGLWRQKDPQFARQMQWMFHQQRSYSAPGIGGGYPALSGYRPLLLDPTIPEQIPSYGSELFPQTGVMLRTGFPGLRETSLHMIAGKHRSHYDYDSGSITFWGKGRILCDDFGYYGRAPSEDHSMVTAAAATADVMNVEAFVPAPEADYVSGVKEAWRRQVLFVKDTDPLGPNYAVVCDTLSQPDRTATWRLWTTSAKLDLHERSVAVTGTEDVDMDVHFALPEKPALKQEAKSRTSAAALRPDGSQSKFPTTQNGIIVPMAGHPVVTALLLPRMKTDKPMPVTMLCEGRVIHVRTDNANDWIFLSASPFSFKQDDIEFEGTVGLVQIRGDKALLTLPSLGRLKARGQVLDKAKPLPQAKSAASSRCRAGESPTI